MFTKVEWLIIDLDDTLCNSSECYVLWYQSMYAFLEGNLSFSLNEIITAIKKWREVVHKRLKGQWCSHKRLLYIHTWLELLTWRSSIILAQEAADIFNNTVIDNLLSYKSNYWNTNLQTQENRDRRYFIWLYYQFRRSLNRKT